MDGLEPHNKPLKLSDFGVMALASQQPRHFGLQLIGRALSRQRMR
jgi:hypothetical protein